MSKEEALFKARHATSRLALLLELGFSADKTVHLSDYADLLELALKPLEEALEALERD